MKNLAFHHLLIRKMIILPTSHYLTYTFSLKDWENVLFELGSERVKLESIGSVKGQPCFSSILPWAASSSESFSEMTSNALARASVCSYLSGASRSEKEKSRGVRLLAISCSSNWPAISWGTPSCLKTRGMPVLLTSQ